MRLVYKVLEVQFQDKNYSMLKAHMRAAKEAFKASDYYFTTIYSNRILSDGLIINNIRYGIIGFIIRYVAMEYTGYQRITVPKNQKKNQTEIKRVGDELFERLADLQLSDSLEHEDLWNILLDFENGFRKFKEFEGQGDSDFAESNSFAEYSLKWLISYISSHKDFLLIRGNNFLKGIANDIDRTGNLMGYNLKILLTISCIIVMDWTNDYVRRIYEIDKELFDKEIKEFFWPAVDKINNLLSIDSFQVNEMTELIWEFLKKWREYYLLFMDLNVTLSVKEESTPLSQEYKEKLVDAISRSVSKEMKQND